MSKYSSGSPPLFPRAAAQPSTAGSRRVPRKGITAVLAALFLTLMAVTTLDVVRDFQRSNAVRQAALQKRQFALQAEVELGRAVQDFKDCLLRNDPSYCDDFSRHLQAIDRTASLYDAQGTQFPAERKLLPALKRALSTYASDLDEMRDMQNRGATIRQIDGVVKGADRPIAAALGELAALGSDKLSGWRLPLAQLLWLILYATLAGLLLSMTFESSIRPRKRSGETARSLRQLSNRMIEWEENRKTEAFVRLHDGVCESLSGIMYFLKSAQHATAGSQHLVSERIPEPIIPSLQAVIRDARAVALQLRPPRMQEAGVLATIHSMWVDCRVGNPRLVIEPRALIDEKDIPEDLKPVILRISQMTLECAKQQSSAPRIGWMLEHKGEALRLSLDLALGNEETPTEVPTQTGAVAPNLDLLDAIRARVVLSGGSYDCARGAPGCSSIICSWPLGEAAQE